MMREKQVRVMTAQEIVQTALALGYESCGIIPVEDVADYAEKLAERIERKPLDARAYGRFFGFAEPQKAHPWAKSIVVCVSRYGKYRLPEHLEGHVAKYYLVDARRDAASAEYQASIAFDAYLKGLGLQTLTERKFGVTALRWAAYKAGLGIIRRNNFFYTDSGSWVHLEAWLIDEALEYKQENHQKPCPPNCRRCIEACPTQSLNEPYTMSKASCVSNLTTWEGDDLPHNPYRGQMGAWIYGCDACQDVCPFNANRWEALEEYPGLEEIGALIGLEEVVMMDEDVLLEKIQPKFWYVGPERVWKWRVNALNAMCNDYDEKYAAAIAHACESEHEKVREMGEFVKGFVDGGF